jgi:hypothetical protein
MGMGPAPFYVNRAVGHDDCGGSLDALHYLLEEPVSYCGVVVELADDVEIEMTDDVCETCERRFRQARPRAFVPPGTHEGS